MLQPQFFRMKPDLAKQITGQAGDYLAVTVPFRSAGDSVGDLRYLQAGVERYAFSLGPYRPLLTIGLPTGLFVALVASQLIARRAVSPIQRLSVAAQSVSSTSFSERIRVPTTDNEISKLQHELNSALERLEQGYRAQEQFIANVSHELKTPIAVVLTESQVVKLGAENVPKYREYVDRVEEEMQRLGALVESFLTLTRFEMATEQPFHDAVSINDVILDSIGHCNGYAQRKAIQVVPFLLAPSSDDVDPLVVGDQDILRTMLDNLVRNAIRHSPENGSVQIEASLRGDEIAVEVRDQGPGIPEEFLDKIFDRFVQVPRDGTKRRGTGIGLAIAQNIAHLHRGVITAANSDNGGCTFRISLPAHRPAPEEPAERPGSDAVA
jgi:signal transduction histidine kinase